MNKLINLRSNRIKFAVHGFFFSAGISVAEPSTLLPLIVDYFSGSSLLVGIYSSLLRGGAVVMQIFTAFYAQSYSLVMRPLRIVFFFRFLFWTLIGLSIYLFGKTNPVLTLWCIGIFLFSFSFFAGIGTIYFHELLGKLFTNEYRGVTLAYRFQLMGLGGIISGLLASHFLRIFEKPDSFSNLFMLSALIMSIGYVLLGTVKEFPKQNTQVRENKFSEYFYNLFRIMKSDKELRFQIITRFLSYSYLMSLPFIVIHAKQSFDIGKLAMGSAVPLLTGILVGNYFWGKLSSKNHNKIIVIVSHILIIIALLIPVFAQSYALIIVLFFLSGCATDGLKLAFANLILVIAPEQKRPNYVAIQNNITSFGLFFSIPGGWLLKEIGFTWLVLCTVLILSISLLLSFKLKNH